MGAEKEIGMGSQNGAPQVSPGKPAVRTVPDPKREPVTTKTVERLERDTSLREVAEIARKYVKR